MNTPPEARRLVLILPCCIGDVVIGTAVLSALRRAYPDAHVTWAVGSWSRAAVENHPDVNAILDTGAESLPVKSVGGFARFVRQLRGGGFDLAVSLVRSPLMSAAVLLAGIPLRAGLDSRGRGFGYNIRAPINPDEPRHEGEIYLDVARAMGIRTDGCYANVPVQAADQAAVSGVLAESGVSGRYLVINPAGGRNPGMVLDAKRYPPDSTAALTNRLTAHYGAAPVVIGAASDTTILDAVAARLDTPPIVLAGHLSFGQIAALAAGALAYIGNDTGLTHLAAAAGAKTIMILGPTDPVRYAPFVAPGKALALWKPAPVAARGVAAGMTPDWDWARDGIAPDEAFARIVAFLEKG